MNLQLFRFLHLKKIGIQVTSTSLNQIRTKMEQAQANLNDDIYICPHFREAYLRAAGQNGNNGGDLPFNLNDAPGVLENARGAGVAVAGLANGALNAAGFAAQGVRGGSLASSYQSSVGNVARESLFSRFQHTGQTGGIATDGLFALAIAGVVAAGTLSWNIWSSYRQIQEEEENINRGRGLEALARANGGRLLCDQCRREEENRNRE